MLSIAKVSLTIALVLTFAQPSAAGGEDQVTNKSAIKARSTGINMKRLDMLRCEMSSQAAFGSKDAVTIKIAAKNESDKTIRFLKRNTPFETFFAAYLRVTRNGKPLSYNGPVAKRAVPSADEYATLAPGASIERSFELFPAYDVTGPGQYQVQWSGEVMDAAVEPQSIKPDDGTPYAIRCAPMKFERK